VQMPTKFKEVVELTVNGNQVTITTVFDGKQAWIKAGDKDVKVTRELLDEFKEAAYGMSLAQGMFFKDKSLKLAALGEAQVKGKPAVGVKVSKEGKKDFNIYFDKATGLIRKVEMCKRDLMTGQEVTEDRFITEYQNAHGRKVAKRAEIQRDGKGFLELEAQEVQILESVDAGEVVPPQ